MSRHTALRISTMCRRTALHVMFKRLAHRPTSERRAIMQSGGVPALRVKLTPGPQGMSEDEEDWGEWKGDGRRAHDDQRRPRSPSLPPAHLSVPMNQIELLHLPVRQQVPALGSHRFTLRTGCWSEEIAILIDDVLYYTLPCIATLVFPEPDTWKKSWETVYRSLMPHRHNIIEDEQRVKSVLELPFSPLPHGNPGPWTAHPGVPAVTTHCSAWHLRRGLALYSQDQTDVSPVLARQKNARKNLFGILFSFEPRRLLPDKHRTQSNSPFLWAHNTNMHAAINILRDEELVRPSKWQTQPLPNRDYTNWNEVRLPPMGFYCTGSLMTRQARQQPSSLERTVTAPYA